MERELDSATALRLCALTSEFYRANAESFSQTRQAPWQGWERVLAAAGVAGDGIPGVPAASDAVSAPGDVQRVGVTDGAEGACGERDKGSFRVLDVACGNLRFERYLVERLDTNRLACFAVDNCNPLIDQAQSVEGLPRVSFQNLNVIDTLAAGSLASVLEVPDAACDMAVAFGFMHHVPLERWRVALLRALAAKVRPGGYVAVSFWRFLNSEKLAKKAQKTTARAQVELGLPDLPPNDFLLGWQQTSGLYRYCHHFDEPEIERLLAAVADIAQPVACFSADGKTGNLNEYVVLRVR